MSAKGTIWLASFFVLLLLSCGEEPPGNRGEGAGKACSECPEDAEDLSFEQRAAARCEHDVAVSECGSCRYEVGLVRVSPALMQGGKAVVRTRKAGMQKVVDPLHATGEIQLNENAAVHISPRVAGIVEEVKVDIGARVEKGAVLFTINSVELGKSLSAYNRSVALEALSRKNAEREKSLFDRKISSEQDLIHAQITHEEHKAELDAAEQALHVLGVTHDELEEIGKGGHGVSEGRLAVRAPIDGTVIRKHAVVGELVEPGRDVILLADLATVWAWADIYEQDLQRLLDAEKAGKVPVEIAVRAFPGRPFRGTIDYVGATMEEGTRTVKVRATIENPGRLLRPGMFCEARILYDSGEEALAVPAAALLSDEGENFVFVRWKEDLFARRAVKKGREFPGGVEILDGLKPGEEIVSEGAFLLKSDVLREKMGAGCAD